jgi:diphthamide biosynthesis protein 2
MGYPHPWVFVVAGVHMQVYVLADTSYNPLSIDEVAAAHVKADCVVS